PNAQSIEGASHDEIESHFAEKLLGFVGKHFMPELARAMAAQGNADIKVFVNKSGFTVSGGTPTTSLGGSAVAAGATSMPSLGEKAESARLVTTENPTFGNATVTLNNAPIVPETNKSWAFLRLLLIAVIIAVAMFFFFYRR